MQIRQAVVLVGGRGTRMWPLTESMPKALLPVAGVPFVEYQLRMLAEVGVEEVVLAVGRHQQEAWEAFVAARSGVPRLLVAFEDEPLDTAGPVTAALDRLDDRFLVLNGDVIFDTSLADFLAQAPDAAATLALAEVPDTSMYGVVVTGDDDLVRRFVEKPSPGMEPANTVNAGVYLIERRALEPFELGPLSFERRVFPELAAHKELAGIVVRGRWLDIGTPYFYLDTHETILTGHSGFASSGPHQVGEGAVIEGEIGGGWSWVGAGAVIESGAMVKDAVVLSGARIHRGARVANAVIGWDAEILSGAVVTGETMVGKAATIGPGCELRHGVRIAPGIRLGPGAVTFSPPR